MSSVGVNSQSECEWVIQRAARSKIPLRVNPREAEIIQKRLQARGKLRNATLHTLLERLDQLRCDPEYQRLVRETPSRDRAKRLSELRRDHKLTVNEARRAAFDHWQASEWMPKVIEARIALALSVEVWEEDERSIYECVFVGYHVTQPPLGE